MCLCKVFNMITKVNEGRLLVKLISCDCKCKFNTISCYSNQKWNNDKCQGECKTYRMSLKDFNGILAHVLVRLVVIKKYF